MNPNAVHVYLKSLSSMMFCMSKGAADSAVGSAVGSAGGSAMTGTDGGANDNRDPSRAKRRISSRSPAVKFSTRRIGALRDAKLVVPLGRNVSSTKKNRRPLDSSVVVCVSGTLPRSSAAMVICNCDAFVAGDTTVVVHRSSGVLGKRVAQKGHGSRDHVGWGPGALNRPAAFGAPLNPNAVFVEGNCQAPRSPSSTGLCMTDGASESAVGSAGGSVTAATDVGALENRNCCTTCAMRRNSSRSSGVSCSTMRISRKYDKNVPSAEKVRCPPHSSVVVYVSVQSPATFAAMLICSYCNKFFVGDPSSS